MSLERKTLSAPLGFLNLLEFSAYLFIFKILVI